MAAYQEAQGFINRFLIVFLLLLALAGALLSTTTLIVPSLLTTGPGKGYDKIDKHPNLMITALLDRATPEDSPYLLSVQVNTSSLQKNDLVYIVTYSSKKLLTKIECTPDTSEYNVTYPINQLNCKAKIPYDYKSAQQYEIIATLIYNAGKEYRSNAIVFETDWSEYESLLWIYFLIFGSAIVAAYIILGLPITFFIYKIATKTKYKERYQSEYSWYSLFFPLDIGKDVGQKIHALLLSPYFWILQFIGIALIIAYMTVSAQAWESGTAFIAFFLSGGIAFIIPFLLCAAFWYVDFREREPLRILATLFLWGMISALMAIGVNTLASDIFSIFGLSILATFLIAPVVEECFKGTGLCLLSEHHQFNSVEDGIIYGFVTGMGFAFIENWIYFLNNPFGADIFGWVWLFILRSVIFSANHGFYTGITGGIIGYLKERNFQIPALGFFIGVPLAAFFHAMHNSGTTIISLLGIGGVIIYCCLLIPLFDYGGLIVFLIIFARAVMRKGK